MDSLFSAMVTFLLSLLLGVFLVWLTYQLSKKSGLLPAQRTLVETLKDNVEAMQDKVKNLEEELATQRDLRVTLETRVRRLAQAIVDLVQENVTLRRRQGLPAKKSKVLLDLNGDVDLDSLPLPEEDE